MQKKGNKLQKGWMTFNDGQCNFIISYNWDAWWLLCYTSMIDQHTLSHSVKLVNPNVSGALSTANLHISTTIWRKQFARYTLLFPSCFFSTLQFPFTIWYNLCKVCKNWKKKINKRIIFFFCCLLKYLEGVTLPNDYFILTESIILKWWVHHFVKFFQLCATNEHFPILFLVHQNTFNFMFCHLLR